MQLSEVLYLFPEVQGVATCSFSVLVVLFTPFTVGSQANWMFFLLPGFVLGGGGKGGGGEVRFLKGRLRPSFRYLPLW